LRARGVDGLEVRWRGGEVRRGELERNGEDISRSKGGGIGEEDRWRG
jgi:hypothetical protein